MKQIIAILNDSNFAHTIFDHLDVSESTRKDYISRINLFLDFIKQRDFNLNSFLEYKHYLKEKPT